MKAVLLAGGEVVTSARLQRLVADPDLVVAADSGLRHARSLGLVPDLLVGDFDSVATAELDHYPELPRHRHPRRKDELDLELAVAEARRRGARSLIVVGALGGRLDQTLAALLIAARLRLEGVRVTLLGDRSEAWLLGRGDVLEPELAAGTTFSLLALREAVTVSASGAAYPLREAALPYGVGRGVSNLAAADLKVTVHSGLLALIVEHAPDGRANGHAAAAGER